MRKTHRMGIGLLALTLFVSGCYGPFYLTRKVWKFNGEVSDNKWVVELVYLLCTWLPVYAIAGAADAIIFNSVEFWTGENPLAEGASAQGTSATRRIVRGDMEAILKRVNGPAGEELLIEQFRHGQPTASLRVQRQGDGLAAFSGDGALLFRAQTLADGRVVVTDNKGHQIASYTNRQARQLLASIPQ